MACRKSLLRPRRTAAPTTLNTVPHAVTTMIRINVVAAPRPIVQNASATSQLKSSILVLVDQVFRIQWLAKPFDRNLVERAVFVHCVDRMVESFHQRRLVFVYGEMIGRGQELDFLLGLNVGVACEHLTADVVADRHELSLAGQERLDHRAIIVEATDIGCFWGCARQRGIVKRPADDANALVGEVSGGSYAHGVWADQR